MDKMKGCIVTDLIKIRFFYKNLYLILHQYNFKIDKNKDFIEKYKLCKLAQNK